MKTRIISAVILLPLFIFVLVKGGYYLALFTLLCSILAVNEFCNALDKYSSKYTKILLFIMTTVQIIGIYFQLPEFTVSALFILLFIQGIMVSFEKTDVIDAGLSIFVFCYISVSMSYIYLLSQQYIKFFWYIFIISMTTDTFAYFTGVFLGKHKLSPKLSPKKTVEGSIGGIIACVLACFIYAYFNHIEIMKIIVPFSIIGSIVSQLGDIFASAFKRYLNIKDYGNIIPGHGGILDRADSIIFTSSYIYIVIKLFFN